MARSSDPLTDRVLDQCLVQLESFSGNALQTDFKKLYGHPPPNRFSDTHLRLAIAYRLQEKAYGGMKPVVRRNLLSVESRSVSKQFASPGTLLVREWRGGQHMVVIHDRYVEYAGEQFRSLTEVAARITGQKRSGPAFFGLRDKVHG